VFIGCEMLAVPSDMLDSCKLRSVLLLLARAECEPDWGAL